MVEMKLRRVRSQKEQTLGVMDVYKDNLFQASFAALERAWLNNVLNKSCIPTGSYSVVRHNTSAHPNTFELLGTEPRSAILLHTGNFVSDSAGCILIGSYHKDLNSDGLIDVAQSGAAMDRLNEIVGNENVILITIT